MAGTRRNRCTERNFEAFKLKLRCVFCEHLLSARARARGIPLVDIRPKPLADRPGLTWTPAACPRLQPSQ